MAVPPNPSQYGPPMSITSAPQQQPPLSTAHLQNPGEISTLSQLQEFIGANGHKPVWVSPQLYRALLQHYGSDNSVVAHPAGGYSRDLPPPDFPPAHDFPEVPTYNPGPTVLINPRDGGPAVGRPVSNPTAVNVSAPTNPAGPTNSPGGWDPFGNTIDWGPAGGIGPQGNTEDSAGGFGTKPFTLARYL